MPAALQHQHVVEPGRRGISPREHLERTDRRVAVIELGVALVEDHQEAMLARHRDRLQDAGRRQHHPLGIRRRAKVEDAGAREQIGRERIEIGLEMRPAALREVARLGASHDRAHPIGLVEGIGHQRDRVAPLRPDGDRSRQVQRLAGARHRRELAVGPQAATRRRIAPIDPAGHCRQEGRRAERGRIAVPFAGVGGHRLCEQRRRRVLGFAHVHRDRGERGRGLQVGEQRIQAPEG
jgi:hypothetical protein